MLWMYVVHAVFAVRSSNSALWLSIAFHKRLCRSRLERRIALAGFKPATTRGFRSLMSFCLPE